MRILHINDYAYPLGGAETYLAALIKAQRSDGNDVRLLASASRGGGTLELYAGKDGFYSNPHYLAFGTSSSSKICRAGIQLVNYSALKTAHRALQEFRPQIVHVHMYLGQLSPLVLKPFVDAGIALVHTSHTYRIACPKGDRLIPNGTFCEYHTGTACIRYCSLLSYAHMWIRESMHRKPHEVFGTVIAPGSTMKKILQMEGFARVILLPYGSTVEQREFIAERCTTRDVLYIGRLVANKGVDYLIRAFAEARIYYPGARLNIAGDGPARTMLERIAAELLPDESYRFYGSVDSMTARNLQDRSRIQCVPSIWPDNSPLVVYEALTAGIPLVASRIGGIPDLMRQGQDGIMVKPADTKELIQAIIDLLGNDEKCMQQSRSAYEHAKLYAMKQHKKDIEHIYRRLSE